MFLHLFVLPACRMAALLQAFADKRVLVCAWCVSMEGARSAPWMWVAICRTGVRGPLLAASLAFERLPSKQLEIGFPLSLMHHRALWEARV